VKLRLLRSALLRYKRKHISIGRNPLGRINISLHTLEELAKKGVVEIPEVYSARVKAEASPVMTVKIEADIATEEGLPSLTRRIQGAARQAIYSMTGIQVHNVEVDFGKQKRDKPRVK